MDPWGSDIQARVRSAERAALARAAERAGGQGAAWVRPARESRPMARPRLALGR